MRLLVPNLIFPIPSPAFIPATFQSPQQISERSLSPVKPLLIQLPLLLKSLLCPLHTMRCELLTHTQPGTDCYGLLLILCLSAVRKLQHVSSRSEPDSGT